MKSWQFISFLFFMIMIIWAGIIWLNEFQNKFFNNYYPQERDEFIAVAILMIVSLYFLWQGILRKLFRAIDEAVRYGEESASR